MDKLKELREKLAQYKAELQAIASKDAATEAELARSTELAGEIPKLEQRISLLEMSVQDPPPPPEGGNPIGRGDTPPTERRDDPPPLPAIDRRLLVHAGNLDAFASEEDAFRAGMWLRSTCWQDRKAAEWCRVHRVGEETRALTTGLNILGGYLVPLEFERAVINLRQQYGVFRANCRVRPMANDTMMIPRRTSGLTAYFVGDNAEITASDMAWDQVEVTARKMAALCKYSSELAEDSIIDLAATLADEMAYAFALKEDQCGFLGTGTSTYGHISGLITKCTAATATIYTAITGNTAFSTLDLADFEAMVGQLPLFAGIQPKWYISQAGFWASMARLADAAGGVTKGEISEGVPYRFLGFPVVISQVMNSTLTAQTSTKGIAYLGDLNMAATFGERRGITVSQTSDRYYEYDQLAIKATTRFGINVHDVGDSSVAGAIVMLAFPGS